MVEVPKNIGSSNQEKENKRIVNVFSSNKSIIQIINMNGNANLNSTSINDLDETLLYNEENLPLFISFDENGFHYFPNIIYKEEKIERKIKDEFSFIIINEEELKKAKEIRSNRIKLLSFYGKKFLLKKVNLSSIEEKDEEYEI